MSAGPGRFTLQRALFRVDKRVDKPRRARIRQKHNPLLSQRVMSGTR